MTQTSEIIKINTIPNKTGVTMKIAYHPRFTGFCSVGKKPFCGILDIIYYPGDKLIEFESFERWLSAIQLVPLTIEEYCKLVFDSILNKVGFCVLEVTVNATTEVHDPVSVTIRSSVLDKYQPKKLVVNDDYNSRSVWNVPPSAPK